MSSGDSHGFCQGGVPTANYHGDQEHGVRQSNDGDVDEHEVSLLPAVVLRVSVDESHDHSYFCQWVGSCRTDVLLTLGEEDCPKIPTCGDLLDVSLNLGN